MNDFFEEILNFALLLLGFKSISLGLALIGFLVIMCNLSSDLKVDLTLLSSSE